MAAALTAGAPVREVFVDEDVDLAAIVRLAEDAGLPVTGTSAAVIAAMAETAQPQGVLAVCDLLVPDDLATAVDIVMAAAGPVLVLDQVSDPGNLGSAIRTADAVGAAGVVLTPGSVDVHNGKVVRSTAGSLFHLPVLADVPVPLIAQAARQHGRSLVVATGDAADDLFSAADAGRVGQRSCWVVGSEAHGVSAQARAEADLAVRIPMKGGAESLNAAVAAAVVLFVTEHVSRPSGDSGRSAPG